MAVDAAEIVAIDSETSPELEESKSVPVASIVEESIQETSVASENIKSTPLPIEGKKISALSLSSIQAKRELQAAVKADVKESVHLPTEAFNETDMLLYWTKYAQKLGEKGSRIMESLLLMNDPTLEGTKITIELPNQGSKLDFESEKSALLGYLKGHLHNHDISIEVVVNESIENKFAFTAQDKFNRLKEINPNLELLRRTFDLDI